LWVARHTTTTPPPTRAAPNNPNNNNQQQQPQQEPQQQLQQSSQQSSHLLPQVSEREIRLMWKVLDNDESGHVTVNEWVGFMRRASANKARASPSDDDVSGTDL